MSLQILDSFAASGQSRPPNCGAGLSQDLFLSWRPPLHVKEQPDQSLQPDQLPFTLFKSTSQHKQKLNKCAFWRITWACLSAAYLRRIWSSLAIYASKCWCRVGARSVSVLQATGARNCACWPVTPCSPVAVNCRVLKTISSLFFSLFVIPGHGEGLQTWVSFPGSWQSSPPKAGAGLSQDLFRSWAPPPQVKEQLDQLLHADQLPLTDIENTGIVSYRESQSNKTYLGIPLHCTLVMCWNLLGNPDLQKLEQDLCRTCFFPEHLQHMLLCRLTRHSK